MAIDKKWAVNDSMFSRVGINRYFALTSGIAAAGTALKGFESTMHNAWDDNPNTFTNAGMYSGAFAGEVAGAVSMGMLGLHDWHTYGMREATRLSDGSVYGKLAKGGFERIKGGGALHMTEDAMAKMEHTRKGFYGRGLLGKQKFIRGWGAVGIGAAIGIPMIFGAAATVGMGLMGKALDQAWAESKKSRSVQYDNRYFNTGRYDQGQYQQIGQAMSDYSDKMMSVARVYHSR